MSTRKNTRTTRTARSRTAAPARARAPQTPRTTTPKQVGRRTGRRPVVTVDLPPTDQVTDTTLAAGEEPVAAEPVAVEVQAAEHEHVRLALAELVDNPINPRTELRNLEPLTDSIRRSGIQKNLIVTPLPDGRYLLVDGWRRKHAGLAAGQTHTDCEVRQGLTTEDGRPTPEQLAVMLETSDNQDALSRRERAHGWAQMVALPGMTVTKVARRLGIDSAEVKQAIAATKLDPAVEQVFYSRDLTLDDVLALSEFEDDPRLHAKVLDKLAKGAGSYVIAEEKHRRVLNAAKKAARAELAEAGCPIVTDPGWHFPSQSLAQPVSNLRDKRGRAIGQAKHSKCSGHAAFLRTTSAYSSDNPVQIVYVCTDPEAHGHTLKTDYSSRKSAVAKAQEAALTPEQIAEREAADDDARLAWAAAAETRRPWLGQLVRAKSLNPVLARRALGASRPIRQTAPFAAALLTGKPEIEDGDKARRACDKLADTTPVAGLHRHTVAYCVADQEHALQRLDVADRSPWIEHLVAEVAAWLTLLVELGYQTSDIEQQVIERGTATIARNRVDEDDDEDDTDEGEAADVDDDTTAADDDTVTDSAEQVEDAA